MSAAGPSRPSLLPAQRRGAALAGPDEDAVLVQGESLEAITDHLRQIRDAVAEASGLSDGQTRGFLDEGEFRGGREGVR